MIKKQVMKKIKWKIVAFVAWVVITPASLTPAILKKMWIEKWDGYVPQVTTGGNNSTFIDISKLK